MRRLFDELGLVESHARGELGARTQEAFGDGRAASGGHVGDAFSESEEFGELGIHT